MVQKLEGLVTMVTVNPEGFSVTRGKKYDEIPSLDLTIETQDKKIETVHFPLDNDVFVCRLVANKIDGQKVKYFGDASSRMYILWVMSGLFEGLEYSYQGPKGFKRRD